MTQVRSAIHVRTGQRATTDAVDQWLRRQVDAVVCLSDPYEACVHLLTRYGTVPDIAFVGVDALRRDELSLLLYLRQTWPRTIVVTYGNAAGDGGFALLPRSIGFQGESRVRELLGLSAAGIVQLVCDRAEGSHAFAPVPQISPAAPAASTVAAIPPYHGPFTAPHASPPLTHLTAPVAEGDAQRPTLTAQELSALLDGEP